MLDFSSNERRIRHALGLAMGADPGLPLVVHSCLNTPGLSSYTVRSYQMPSTGLALEQMNSRPWHLDTELLRPAKTITDPVHRDIFSQNLSDS